MEGKLGSLDGYVHTAVFKMDDQQGLTVQHRELCSMLCGSLDGRGVWGRMDTCICMVESLPCLPETITVSLPGESHGQRSLVGYSPWSGKESDMTEHA